jgi:hypothetical protein
MVTSSEPYGTETTPWILRSPLFYELIRAQQQRRRDGEGERLGGLRIDHEFEFSRFLHWKLSGFRAIEDFPDVLRATPPHVSDVGAP